MTDLEFTIPVPIREGSLSLITEKINIYKRENFFFQFSVIGCIEPIKFYVTVCLAEYLLEINIC